MRDLESTVAKLIAEQISESSSTELIFNAVTAHQFTVKLEKQVLQAFKMIPVESLDLVSRSCEKKLPPEQALTAVMIAFTSRMIHATLKQAMYMLAPEDRETTDTIKRCYVDEQRAGGPHAADEELFLRALYHLTESAMDDNMVMLQQVTRSMWCMCDTCNEARSKIFNPKSPDENCKMSIELTAFKPELFNELRMGALEAVREEANGQTKQ